MSLIPKAALEKNMFKSNDILSDATMKRFDDEKAK